jgi:enoyl-CoA hydratase
MEPGRRITALAHAALMTRSPPPMGVEVRQRNGADQVAYVTLDDERRLNCLSEAMLDQLTDAMDQLGKQSMRAAVIRGAGARAFVCGGDLELLSRADKSEARRYISKAHAANEKVRMLSFPVIAAINGYCFGGGLELAAACDIRIATTGSQFAMPEVRVGVPAVVQTALLPTLIGSGRTSWLCFTGRPIDAQKALAWGLVEEVVASDRLDETVEQTVSDVLEGAPSAVQATKAQFRRGQAIGLAQGMLESIDVFAQCYDGDEPSVYGRRALQRLGQRNSRGSAS